MAPDVLAAPGSTCYSDIFNVQRLPVHRPMLEASLIRHHPSAEALAEYLIGDCSPGTALLVERHTQGCSSCAARLTALGGSARSARVLSAGQWRPVGDGVTAAPAHDAAGLGEKVYFMRLSRMAAAPLAQMEIAEMLVLEGELAGDEATYATGDYIRIEGAAPAALTARKVSLCLATAADRAFGED